VFGFRGEYGECAREGAGWIDVKVRQPDVYACYSRVSGMARITINMLDSRLTAVVPDPPSPSSYPLGRFTPFDLADTMVDFCLLSRYANVSRMSLCARFMTKVNDYELDIFIESRSF